ncbi:hypothetical protein RCG23_24330 [Neobacillus sp. PS3-34]|uniref:hypothetical protein n=1 Tax=Neobacillus sp. PS3-34 TaxID=3070678 RepID=UPI0027E097A3|nr:hypothetical protein [Neobacillus sp. PS3-34]WML48329.1 hypothetical protein RCG23_24330 [Neobacillus sp. PS3-34]
MKNDMGELLLHSWLRHIKQCQSVQLNWMASIHNWELKNEDRILETINEVKSYFRKQYGYSLFKQSTSCKKLLQYGEIDVLGLQINGGMVANIYGVNIALFEEEWNESGAMIQPERIITSMVKTAMLIYGHFNLAQGNIIFASPKINNANFVPLATIVNELKEVFQQLGFQFEFTLLANHNFKEIVYEPLRELTTSFTDIQESSLPSEKASSEIAATKTLEDPIEISIKTEGVKIGPLVRREMAKLISKNLISPEKIQHSQDKKYCKEILDIDYPLLKKVNDDQPIIDQSMLNGNQRYWKKVYKLHGEKYLLCSQWTDRNSDNFITWLNLFY